MALIQITDLTFAYPGSFDNVFEHVSFQFDTDWRLGLTGRNGRGKTTLLRLLQGQYPHQGTITAPGGFEYFPYPVPDASLTPLELLERSGLPLYGAALRDDTADVRDVDYRRCAVAIGSEGRGLSAQMLQGCTRTVRIPMSAHCESLNAAAAAAVLLWEAARGD